VICGAVRYAELAGDGRQGAVVVEGLHQHGPVRGRKVPQRVGDELPVKDLIQARVDPGNVGRLRRCGDRPCPRGPVGVRQQIAGDAEQPGPDRPVVGGELRQVPPGPDQGLLHDVVGARPVGAEPLDITVQGLGVTGVQLAYRGVGVGGQLPAGSSRDSRHGYYHG